METTLFYQGHLNRVSRSFAFCIARLEGELRDWVSLSYLLCRLLDTVEDAPWMDPAGQDAAFDIFRKFLENPPGAEEVSRWAAAFPSGIDEGEMLLLLESHRCFAELHALPEPVKEKILNPVLNMYRGMRFFLGERRLQGGGLKLRTLAEVNQYCFFVAGLVGDLLTELVAHKWPSAAGSRGVLLDAHHFGLFLQKVNLLKDQAKDEKEGRFLVPSRAELVASLRKDAEGALRYLVALPVAEKGFRLFCAWSLFLGLASLPWIERSKVLGLFLKIPRFVTESLLQKVERLIDDNQALVRLFQEMLPASDRLATHTGPVTEIPWMREIYQGKLGPAEFQKLGMLPSAG